MERRRGRGMTGLMMAFACLLVMAGGGSGGGAEAQDVVGPTMPIWAAGDNRYGTLGVAKNLGTSATNDLPIQNDGESWAGHEVLWVSSGWRHAAVQTANRTLVTQSMLASLGENYPTSLERRSYVWGWNRYGQLGTVTGVSTDKGQPPLRLSRTLFPRAEAGNEISSSNHNVRYWIIVGSSRASFDVTLPHGLMDAAGFASAMMQLSKANGHSGSWLTARVEGDQNVLSVVEGGYQLDLTVAGSPSASLGFTPLKIPGDTYGTLGEVSASLGNNKIDYRYLVGSTWTDRTLTLPFGTYQSVSQVNAVVKAELQEIGMSQLSMSFGIDYITGRLYLDFYNAGIEVVLSTSTTTAALGFGTVGTVPSARDWSISKVVERVHAESTPRSLLLSYLDARSDIAGDVVHRISAGRAHTLVQTYSSFLNRKRLWALGLNRYGQLGTGINAGLDVANPVPALVGGGAASASAFHSATLIRAGGDFSAVVDSSGQLWLFGSNLRGQLGRSLSMGSWSSTPMLMDAAPPWTPSAYLNLTLGFDHGLVVSGGQAWAWGSNEFGQLGADAVSITGSVAPLAMSAPSSSPPPSWQSACTGSFHTVLLSSDMRVYACGYNAFGQAGRLPVQQPGANDAFEPSLANIPLVGGIGAERVEMLACGSDHAIVLLSNASMYGFGLNSFGQLMDETNAGLANPNPQFLSISPNGEGPFHCYCYFNFNHCVSFHFPSFPFLPFSILSAP